MKRRQSALRKIAKILANLPEEEAKDILTTIAKDLCVVVQ